MNKTLKTIAWICLALGLLGMVVDAGALIYGRTLMANKQAAFEEVREAVQSGTAPEAGNRCIAVDANKDGKPDGDCLQSKQPGQPDTGKPGFGGRQGRGGMMANNRGGFNGGRLGGRGIFPMFFMALGPVLALIGAVILLVNREPKAVLVKEEKEVKEVKKKENKK